MQCGTPSTSCSWVWAGRSSNPKREMTPSMSTARRGLPAVMRECFVGLRHAVDVVLPLPGAALLLVGVEDLGGEALGHRVLPTGAGELDQPADREGAGAAGRNLDRDLIGGTADAAGANLEHRGQLFDRRLQRLHGILAAALADDRQA